MTLTQETLEWIYHWVQCRQETKWNNMCFRRLFNANKTSEGNKHTMPFIDSCPISLKRTVHNYATTGQAWQQMVEAAPPSRWCMSGHTLDIISGRLRAGRKKGLTLSGSFLEGCGPATHLAALNKPQQPGEPRGCTGRLEAITSTGWAAPVPDFEHLYSALLVGVPTIQIKLLNFHWLMWMLALTHTPKWLI